MIPVFLFLLFLSMTAVPLRAADNENQIDENTDPTEVISKANADIKTPLIFGDIAPSRKRNAVPCTATGCKWPKSGSYVYIPIYISNQYSGKEHNFRKVNTNNQGTGYDFNSVMHYSNTAFSRNGQPTIISKDNPSLSFGRAASMSATDIARINKLYGC
ncbi:PREDICTED: astacin-like metalloendopeptidase [Cyprinodon variegatus]|uniref:astacin-like metalloendopeptidase n=1 Tax=Cyprinodon variegatus TaxID=28743 RepID=UPI000742A643|nr:PREDICTED: astacin-like metalloendopeptidase [Cyprinodon variegatus]